MKYYLIAGEASGDLHGASLMKSLKKKDISASFRYFGGDLMQAQGGTLVKHISEMSFMGFVEVLANLNSILKNLKQAKTDIMSYNPDALILIDFPGFNIRVAEFAKKNGIKVFYYISPKVWAWNQKRVLKIKRFVDHMFCILPFEVDFYKKWGMDVFYVGNPLLDSIKAHQPDPDFIQENNLGSRPLIALLPGSRKQEISRLLPIMAQLSNSFQDHQLVIAGAPGFDKQYYVNFMKGSNIPVVFNSTYDLLEHAVAAVVASGTATLETALFNVPQVVVYKGNNLSIAIARWLVKIRFISLVNLIMDREVVKELIQEDCNAGRIEEELNKIYIKSEFKSKMMEDYKELSEKMGESGASDRCSDIILSFL